jgi:exonuclease III
MCWNVRGLNDGAKRASVRNQINSSGATVVCLQETKITSWTYSLLVETVGTDMAQNFVALPSIGASGGILIAVSARFFCLDDPHLTTNTVSASLRMLADNTKWSISGVYGPQSDQDKVLFMQEISGLKQLMLPEWLLLGDFNLIYRAQDKNNGRLNLPLLNAFKSAIDNLLLVPIELQGKKYTWSNDQQSPTMTKIDHVFASSEWLVIFPRTHLQALASLGSDHCPLYLQGDVNMDFYRGFRFESHWPSWPGFLETVKEVWDKPVNTQDAILRVHVKLLRTAKVLKLWRRKNFNDWKVRWAILNITLANLERAQESRTLTQDELVFKRYLKNKALGLASIQKTRARQHSRLTWMRKGDSNTKFFHLHANARRKKVYIPSLAGHVGIVVLQEEKASLIHTHFSRIMGTPDSRTKAINWDELGYVHHNLDELDAPFTQEEIAMVIKEMPAEKSPRPDGFIGLFYKKCWTIIKDDLTQAILSFY